MQMHINAEDVLVGDKLYNEHAARPEFRWLPVIDVQIAKDVNRIIISMPNWDAWKHPHEGVLVERKAPPTRSEP